MKYLSLFSGIEAASAAWKPLGWQPVAFAEVEPFPCAVLAHHHPDVPNLGDVSEITHAQIAALGHIDVVVGGSPCQGLSLAGTRKGLADERSGLFYEQVRIFHAAHTLCGARYLVWENVPGALSNQAGRDFAVVVGTLAGCRIPVPERGWGSEGLALGHYGLLEWSVLDAQRFGLAQRRKRVFAVLDTGNWQNRCPILFERDSLRGDCPTRPEPQQDATPCVDASPIVPSVAMCLNAGAMGRQDAESETFVLAERGRPGGRSIEYRNDGTANAILTPIGGGAGRGIGTIAHQQAVSRLTPRECERLQGFPDDYTAIPWRGKPAESCPDSPRYRALGNSMAVPVMRWIGQQIDAAINTSLMEQAA